MGMRAADDAHFVLFAEPRETDSVAERDRRGIGRGALFASAREHLPGGDHPADRRGPVMVQ